jgi:serine protease Do
MSRSARFTFFAFLLGLLGAPAVAQEPPSSGQKLALYTKPAVVRIYGAWIAQFRFNNRTWPEAIGGTGSGFFISPDGYVATNAHVVQVIHDGEDKAKEALAQAVIKDIITTYKADFAKMTQDQARKVLANVEMGEIKKLNFVILPNGDRAAYDIKAYGAPIGEGKDCAVIKIPTKNAPTLVIGDSQKVQIQDRVYVIGYPGVADVNGLLDEKSQLEASITDGAISAVKTTADGDQVIQVSAPITHGNSGGPAVNERGEVVGLATFGNVKEVQGFNFLVASSTLAEFVRQAGASPASSETDREWHTALDLFWDARYTAAIEKLQEVESLFPAQVEAKKLEDQARDLKRAGKERKSGAIWLVVAGLAVVVLAGAALLLMRKGKGGASAAPRPVGAQPSQPSGPAIQSAEQQRMVIPPTIAVAGSSQPVPKTMFAEGRVGSLTCTRGKLVGQRFSLTPEGILIGRQPGVAHIVVNDGRASGEHVWLKWEEGKLFAIDQGTTNGTFLNDLKRGRISRAEVKDGDVVIVADPECCSLSVKLG